MATVGIVMGSDSDMAVMKKAADDRGMSRRDVYQDLMKKGAKKA